VADGQYAHPMTVDIEWLRALMREGALNVRTDDGLLIRVQVEA